MEIGLGPTRWLVWGVIAWILGQSGLEWQELGLQRDGVVSLLRVWED